MKVSISDIKRIVSLSKKSIPQLRKLNPERAYSGRLTKYELIFQIVFQKDAPIK